MLWDRSILRGARHAREPGRQRRPLNVLMASRDRSGSRSPTATPAPGRYDRRQREGCTAARVPNRPNCYDATGPSRPRLPKESRARLECSNPRPRAAHG